MQNFPEILAFVLATVTLIPYNKVALIRDFSMADCSAYISNIIPVLYMFVAIILVEILEVLRTSYLNRDGNFRVGKTKTFNISPILCLNLTSSI